MTLFYSLPLPIRLIDCQSLVAALHAVEQLSPEHYAANDNDEPQGRHSARLVSVHKPA